MARAPTSGAKARAATEAEARYRRRILSPAAFGIHHQIDKELREFISVSFHHSTFFFHEWFLEYPVGFWDDLTVALGRQRNVVAPFLSRVVHQTGFLPAVNRSRVKELARGVKTGRSFNVSERLYSVPATPTNLNKFGGDLEILSFDLNDTELLKMLLAVWKGKRPNRFSRIDKWGKLFSDLVGSPPVTLSDGVVSVCGILNEKLFSESYLKKVLRGKADAAEALLREYELVLRPWFEKSGRSDWGAGLVSVSISSEALFWGECIVMLPLSRADKSEEPLVEQLRDILVRNVKSTYLPIVTLLENYFHERQFKDDLEKLTPASHTFTGLDAPWASANSNVLEEVGLGIDHNLPFAGVPKTPKISRKDAPPREHLFMSLLVEGSKGTGKGKGKGPWTRSLNELEQALVRLWAARFALVALRTGPADRFYRAKESLVFEKYLIASPRILEQVLNAVRLRHGQGGIGKASIKTALVVGGAGSGKESMAQLIRLFSPGYRLGRVHTWNMATFRPKETAVPLLLGLTVNIEGGHRFSLLGLLTQAWKKFVDWQLDRKANWVPKGNGQGLTLIFDELNSLDMDTQGALLRFLENGELLPLGGLEKTERDDVDALVIGIMNEDPQTITKMRTLNRFLRDKQIFGGMLGEFLYEFFRNQRRLRDDLYFRLIRGGEIILPELRDRREDIPVLFYFTVNADPRDPWEVELSVYETLMDQSITWEGNVRELQTLARQIVAIANEGFEIEKRRGVVAAKRIIRGAHARKALEDHLRDTSRVRGN